MGFDLPVENIAQALEGGFRGFLQGYETSERVREKKAAAEAAKKKEALEALGMEMQAESKGYKLQKDENGRIVGYEADPEYLKKQQAKGLLGRVEKLEGAGYEPQLTPEQQSMIDEYGGGLIARRKGPGLLAKEADAQLARQLKGLQVQKTTKDLTEASPKQIDAQALFKKGYEAERQYQQALKSGEAEGWSPLSTVERKMYIPFVGDVGLPKTVRPKASVTAENASNAWVNAFLRKESGAAIGVDEREQYRQIFFPVYGDSEQDVINKKQLRESIMEETKRQGAPINYSLTDVTKYNSTEVAPSMPKAGQVEDGYEFLGGDPNNQNNWRKVK